MDRGWSHEHTDGTVWVHPTGFDCDLDTKAGAEAARCTHLQTFGDTAVWPRQASLDHFQNCISNEDRLIRWTLLLERAQKNDDYEGRIAALLQQIDQKDDRIRALRRKR